VSEKLTAFINLYNEKAAAYVEKQRENLAKDEANFAEWQELRPQVISMATDFGVGEIAEAIFLPQGGINNDAFRNQGPTLYGIDEELEDLARRLFKVKNAPRYLEEGKIYLQQAIKLQEDGGEVYFNKLMQSIGKKIATLPNPDQGWKALTKSPEDWEEIEYALDDRPESPRGVLLSQELYNLAVENGSPLSKSVEETEETPEIRDVDLPVDNPINEGEEELDEVGENTLNPDEIPEDSSGEGINPGEDAIVESEVEAENTVETTAPEIESELTPTGTEPTREEIDESRGFVELEQVAAINPDADIEDFNTDTDVNVTVPEYNETAPSVINDIQENVANEVTNIQNQINEALENDERSGLLETESQTENLAESPAIEDEETFTFDDVDALAEQLGVERNNVINETTEITEGDTNIVNETGDTNVDDNTFTESRNSEIVEETNTTINPSGESVPDEDDETFTFDDVAALKNRFGIEDNEITNENTSVEEGASNVVNEVTNIGDNINNITEGVETTVNSVGGSINESIESTVSTVNDKMEVAKSKLGIDKTIAPINTPKPKETKEESKESVTMTEVTNESTSKMDGDTSATEVSNVTNNESSNTNNSASAPVVVDMSGLEARLRKIENLLSGPLEVKIIE
jgi:hypothetical protein